MREWAKKFQNGRPSVDIAGPSCPNQNEWIDIESEDDDSLDIFNFQGQSGSKVKQEEMCPLDKWLENWFSRTESKFESFQFYESETLFSFKKARRMMSLMQSTLEYFFGLEMTEIQ